MSLNINEILMKLPLASSAFLAYAVVGAIMLLSGTLEYGSFADNLLAIGIACGAIGVPRAAIKVAQNTPSVNLLGFVESLPIPTLVFVVFLIASSVSLALGIISFGEFSDNIWKVGVACGVLQATRAVEKVFEPPAISA
jgi:hypothetical protein